MFFPNNSSIGFILPKDNKDEGIIDKVMKNDLFANTNINFIQFMNNTEMNQYSNEYNNKLLASVFFESNDYLHYTIRVNGTSAPSPTAEPITNYILGRYKAENYQSTESDSYLKIFSPLQVAVDQAIIQTRMKDDHFILDYQIGKLHKPGVKYINSEVADNASGNLAFIITLAFITQMNFIVQYIVKEKETGIRNSLLMAGVHPSIFWLSYLVIYGMYNFFFSAITIVCLYFCHTFANCNLAILFITFFLYGMSCSSLAFVLTNFFKKSKTAISVVILFSYIICMINMANRYMNELLRKILSILFSPLAMGSFIVKVDSMENRFQNISFNNLFSNSSSYYLLILVINNVLYFGLVFLLDIIFSNERIYLLFDHKPTLLELHDKGEVTYENDIQENFHDKQGTPCIVEVRHVHKMFQRKNTGGSANYDNKVSAKRSIKNGFLAVDDVSFKIYENEIFAILGHNGAGKTTLINIMVDLLKATHGDIFFDGKSITHNLNSIRKQFGVCAQSNVIYDHLTVEDHIHFYADLKGVCVDVDSILKELDLLPQKFTIATDLSGGQKRKLCLSMALIGNPKYIFLDEPTTGLDPLSRRKIWEILQKQKSESIIFLTTHYMDEADILADRKLILSKGKIRCLGTSLYLKNHFNMNYRLNIETRNKEQVHDLILSYIPEATYVCENKGDENNDKSEKFFNNNMTNIYTWSLPLNTTDRFCALFNELERQSRKIEINESYDNNFPQIEKRNEQESLIIKFGLFMPTLEELFNRLEDNDFNESYHNLSSPKEENEDKQHLIQIKHSLPKIKPIKQPSRFDLLKTLIHYRIKIFLKDKYFAYSNILLPVIFILFSFIGINQMFKHEKIISESRILSVSEMYSESYLNLEPNPEFNMTIDQFRMIHKYPDMVESKQLIDIPNPEESDSYYLASVNGQTTQEHYSFTIHYNDTMTHALPASLNSISNAILASRNSQDRIIVKSQPFDRVDKLMTTLGLSFSGLILSICIVQSMGKFGPLITRERINQLLHKLQLNGVSRINYWISCFGSDLFIFLLSCILILAVGVVVQFKPLMNLTILITILILLVIWSIPTLLYQYVFSFLFNKEETAFSLIPVINIYSSMIGYFFFIMINLSSMTNTESLKNDFSEGIFSMKIVIYNMVMATFFPGYGFVAMSYSLFTMKTYQETMNYKITISNLFKIRNSISPVIVVLFGLTLIFSILLIRLDIRKNQTKASDIHQLPEKTCQRNEANLASGDNDVYKEFQYVKAHQLDLPISVLHLSKEYPAKMDPSNKAKIAEVFSRDPDDDQFGNIHRSIYRSKGKLVKNAVIDVNFGVRCHECFGLLGPNGSGKSTILNTLTATIPQTTGKICFQGIETYIARLGDLSMGYCSQNDILWKELTLREHIEFFLQIRGYGAADAKEYATQYINCLGLEDHQHKKAENLSGGTKRKLSLLIAICGYPKQIILDEPTAGMDPSTRRMVWNVIKEIKIVNNSSLIMTTHSMEEAENLCDRLAILINGRLICIGSSEYLKIKFGEGYILEIQSENIERFQLDIIENGHLFGDKEYKVEQQTSNNRCKYYVKMENNLGYVFKIMEQCKKDGLILNYSFNQTSLEQIFINFAKKQIQSQDI